MPVASRYQSRFIVQGGIWKIENLCTISQRGQKGVCACVIMRMHRDGPSGAGVCFICELSGSPLRWSDKHCMESASPLGNPLQH